MLLLLQLVLLLLRELKLLSHAQLVVPHSAVFSIHVFQNSRSSRRSQTLVHPRQHRSLVQFCVTGPSRLTCNTGPLSLVPALVASRILTTRPRANTPIRARDREDDINTLQRTHVLSKMKYPNLLTIPWRSARTPS